MKSENNGSSYIKVQYLLTIKMLDDFLLDCEETITPDIIYVLNYIKNFCNDIKDSADENYSIPNEFLYTKVIQTISLTMDTMRYSKKEEFDSDRFDNVIKYVEKRSRGYEKNIRR